MPKFDTPQPITARLYANSGSIRLSAGERADTVVEVRPHNESRPADVRSAEEARVHYANGTLTVSPAKFGFLGYRMGGVDITVEMPSHSRAQVATASAEVQANGDFGDFKFESASGDLIAQSISGAAKVSTSSGDATIERLDGGLKFQTASGDLIAQSISGAAKVSTSSGDATIERLDGDLKFQTASGSLSVDRLRGNVKHQAASGSVSIATADSGCVLAQTGSGDVEVGIPEGTAARLDIKTGTGVVTNMLPRSDGPAEGEEILEVSVRTGSGDVDIHRSVTAPA